MRNMPQNERFRRSAADGFAALASVGVGLAGVLLLRGGLL